MKRMATAICIAASLFLQGTGGCSSPTSQFDALRGASAVAVAGTNTVEVLQ